MAACCLGFTWPSLSNHLSPLLFISVRVYTCILVKIDLILIWTISILAASQSWRTEAPWMNSWTVLGNGNQCIHLINDNLLFNLSKRVSDSGKKTNGVAECGKEPIVTLPYVHQNSLSLFPVMKTVIIHAMTNPAYATVCCICINLSHSRDPRLGWHSSQTICDI